MYVWQTIAIGVGALACGVPLWAIFERRGRGGWRNMPNLVASATADSVYRSARVVVSPACAPTLVRWASLLAILSALSSLAAFHYGLSCLSYLNGCSGRGSSNEEAIPMVLLPWSTWLMWVSAGSLRNSLRAKWHVGWTGVAHALLSCSVLLLATTLPFPPCGYLHMDGGGYSPDDIDRIPALQAMFVVFAALGLVSGLLLSLTRRRAA